MTSRAYQLATGDLAREQPTEAIQRMRDVHAFAEWQAHRAERDYSVLMDTWGKRYDRPLPIYMLRQVLGGE